MSVPGRVHSDLHLVAQSAPYEVADNPKAI